MGNKWQKLRSFAEKDYSESIGFPVELVGRDGVIRRYSYEESIIVYQKRIESAHQRYGDPDLAEAEIDHCYKRIEQLKRSWSNLSSSEVPEKPSPTALDQREERAANACKEFVRNWYTNSLAGHIPVTSEPINVFLSLLEKKENFLVFYVSVAGQDNGQLLYVFLFDVNEEQEVLSKEQYNQYVQLLDFNQHSNVKGVEQLLSHEDNEDYGFILTGSDEINSVGTDLAAEILHNVLNQTEKPQDLNAAKKHLKNLIEEDPIHADAHYALGVLYVNENNLQSAMEEVMACLALQPYHLDAYIALNTICGHLDRHKEAEPYCIMATHYFPDNETIYFQLGVNYLRQNRSPDAIEPLRKCLSISRDHEEAAKLLNLIINGESSSKALESLSDSAGKSPDKREGAPLNIKGTAGKLCSRNLGAVMLGVPIFLITAYLLTALSPTAGFAAIVALIASLCLSK